MAMCKTWVADLNHDWLKRRLEKELEEDGDENLKEKKGIFTSHLVLTRSASVG